MITKGIRGAITVDNNSEEAIKCATVELLSEMFKANNINVSRKICSHRFWAERSCNDVLSRA